MIPGLASIWNAHNEKRHSAIALVPAFFCGFGKIEAALAAADRTGIMSMNESVAYLKGLAEGLDVNAETKEGKLLLAILDVLEEMSEAIHDVEEVCDEYGELLDTIDEDLGSLEEDFYGDEDCDCEDCGVDGDLYEVTCPNCGDQVYLDEDTLLEGDMDCPNCGQKLEFEYNEEDCCCGENCNCDHE